MKSVDLINTVRSDMDELYQLHNLYVQTNGAAGFQCLDVEAMEQKLRRTDKDIILEGLDKGLYIEDAQECLDNMEKNQTVSLS